MRTGTQLAALLLDRYGIATLPGEAFGERDSELRLRLATSMLYGEDDEQRAVALCGTEPLKLPWIATTLDIIETSLADLLDAGA